MFTKGIETVLSRVVSDGSFEDVLFTDIDRVLSRFELTFEEGQLLREISRDDFKYFKQAVLEERCSFTLGQNINVKMLIGKYVEGGGRHVYQGN